MNRSKSGFTLVEVLVAIAILGIVSAGVIGFFATIVTTARNTDREQTQTISAKTFLEQVAEAWNDSVAFSSTANVPTGLTAPAGCTAVSGAPSAQGVKTMVLTCDAVQGPFVLSLGSIR